MSHLLLRLHVRCSVFLHDSLHLGPSTDTGTSPDVRSGTPGEVDRGQATTEYALVMLGAAVIALLVVSWATAGGGAGKIGRLFDRVIDAVTGKI